MANFNKAKKLHFIYKTTNLINGRYYIGMHSTNNLKDGYMGSGKQLRAAIKKYGEENFQVEILEYLPDRSSLALREKEIVNEDLVKDTKCMNLREGGNGGNGGVGGESLKQRLCTDSLFLEEHKQRSSKTMSRLHREGKITIPSRKDKRHSIETKKKMSRSKKGKCIGTDNSQYGTCWITNGQQNKKIKNPETIPTGWEFGRKIK